MGKGLCLPVACKQNRGWGESLKDPRLRKVNFSPLDEPILQRKVEEKLWCVEGKVTNVEKARMWSEITTYVPKSILWVLHQEHGRKLRTNGGI